MTNQTNVNYTPREKVIRGYGVKQAWTDAGCALVGLGGAVDLIAQYVNNGTVGEYLIGVGLLGGSAIVDRKLSKRNKRKEAKALNNLEMEIHENSEIPFEVEGIGSL